MNLVSNVLEGKYAVPDHPITCSNPAPWKIEEVKIEDRWIEDRHRIVVYIRGADSMWFAADMCYIGTLGDCEGFLEFNART